MNILITGGAGFIGSHLADYLVEAHDVTVLDNLSTGKRENIPDGVSFVEGSILDAELLDRVFSDADHIFHEAAAVSVADSMLNPHRTFEINTIGTLNVLKASVSNGVKKVVFASSAALYGSDPVNPKHESMTPEPKSPYAISKLDGEYLLKMFSEEYGIKTTALRYFNVYGPRQDASSPYSGVISLFVKRALEGEDIVINGDGMQTRDFVYVDDVVRANELALKHGDGMVFNVGTGRSITVNELAERILEITDSQSRIVHGDGRAGDVRYSEADVGAIEGIGYRAQVSVEDGSRRYCEYEMKMRDSFK